MGAAASIIFIVGFWFNSNQKSERASQKVSIEAEPERQFAQKNIIHFVNTKSRMVMHSLPDGSVVWMHSEASISYPKTFEQDHRSIQFEGEGFFDVKSDKKRPFIIQSGEMKIEVLGTRFNVKAPPREMIYEVSVVSGSVSVSAPNEVATTQKVVLETNQQALFETKNKRLTSNSVPHEFKKEVYESVTLTFEGTQLNDVIEQLDKRYDVRIHLVNPKMNTCRITADFEE
jgi:ferric-dicitrate binding protein FerR (iron transport regulator)